MNQVSAGLKENADFLTLEQFTYHTETAAASGSNNTESNTAQESNTQNSKKGGKGGNKKILAQVDASSDPESNTRYYTPNCWEGICFEQQLDVFTECFTNFLQPIIGEVDTCTNTLNETPEADRTLENYLTFNSCRTKALLPITSAPVIPPGYMSTDFGITCAQEDFVKNYEFAPASEIPGCVNNYRKAFRKEVNKCNQLKHIWSITKHDTVAEKKKYIENQTAYNNCVTALEGFKNNADYQACHTFIEEVLPKLDDKAICLVDLEAGFEASVINNCASLKDASNTNPITQAKIDGYNACLKTSYKNYLNLKEDVVVNGRTISVTVFEKCKHLSHLKLPFYTREEILALCMPQNELAFETSGANNQHPGKICQDKHADFNWDPTAEGNSIKKIVKSAEGKAFNKCYSKAINTWIKEHGNPLCATETKEYLRNSPTETYTIFSVKKCVNNELTTIRALEKAARVYDATKTVQANFDTATAELEALNALFEAATNKCGAKVEFKIKPLGPEFNVTTCFNQGTAALNNYLHSCQVHAKTFRDKNKTEQKKLQSENNNACVAGGAAIAQTWNTSKCGGKAADGTLVLFNLADWTVAADKKVKITATATGSSHQNDHHHEALITTLSEYEFLNRCQLWIQDIHNASTEAEYNEITAAYTRFTDIYKNNGHPNATYPQPRPWTWVKAHNTPISHPALTVTESEFINNIMEQNLPSGIDIESSEASFQKHLECIVGETTQETLHHFDEELAWFIGHMKNAHTHSEYFKFKHGYNTLIQIYHDEHHIDLTGHIVDCPAFHF